MALVLDCGADELLRTQNGTIFHLAQSQVAMLQQVAQRIGNIHAANILIKTLSIEPSARPSALEILAAVPDVGMEVHTHKAGRSYAYL
jgi:hypothetical protein